VPEKPTEEIDARADAPALAAPTDAVSAAMASAMRAAAHAMRIVAGLDRPFRYRLSKPTFFTPWTATGRAESTVELLPTSPLVL